MKSKIEKWYKMGLWDDAMVRDAVEKGVITAEEYEEITGTPYAVEGAADD